MKEAGARTVTFWALLAFSLFSPVSIAATNAAWVAALLIWLYESLLKKPRGSKHPASTGLDPALGLLVLASVLSVWTSVDFKASLVEARSLGLIVIYYLFAWQVRDTAGRRKIASWLTASASLAALYGIVQFYTGWDFLGHFQPETRKASGFFSLHLTFGEYLVMTTCLAAGIVLWAERPKPAARAAGILVSLLMAFAVLLSGAKGAFLGLLAGLGVLLSLKGRKALLAGMAVLLLLLVVVFALPESPTPRNFLAVFEVDAVRPVGPMASNTQRLFMWWSGFRISLTHLLYGVGLHGVDVLYPSFRHPLAIDPNQWHLHNNFVQIGVETGLFGLAAFLYFFALAFRSGCSRLRGRGDPLDRGLAAGVLAGMAGFLVSGLTEYTWGDSEVLMCLYMLLGLMLSIPAENHKRPVEKAGRIETHEDSDPLFLGGLPAGVFLAALSVLVMAASFLFPREPEPAGMRSMEMTAGCSLIWLACRRPWVGRLSGLRQRQLAACLVTSAGYAFTRPLWASADLPFAQGRGLVVLAGIVTISVVAGTAWVLFRGLRRWRASVPLFDLAVLAAPLLWVALSLATGFLLGAGGVEQGLPGPPFNEILPLCALVLSLYAGVRMTYGGDRLGRTLLGLTGLCLILHALRG